MALNVKTDKPKALLTAIKSAIDKEAIKTWTYDKEGDFTHSTSSGQWEHKAWLRPSIVEGEALNFRLIMPEGKIITKAVVGIYNGRFAEMLASHFDSSFTTIIVTIP